MPSIQAKMISGLFKLIAENCHAKVWFPLYPMAPEHRLAETLQSTLKVYQDIRDYQ